MKFRGGPLMNRSFALVAFVVLGGVLAGAPHPLAQNRPVAKQSCHEAAAKERNQRFGQGGDVPAPPPAHREPHQELDEAA